MKRISLLFALLLILPVVLATTFGTYKQGECIELLQTCGNCTYVNITSLNYPNSTPILSDAVMTKSGTRYNYTICNTSTTGTYIVSGVGDDDGFPTVWSYDFEVTPSGFGRLAGSGGAILIAFFVLIVIIGLAFLIIGFKSQNTLMKFSFISLGVIVFIMAILFMLIAMQQNLYGYENILIGSENFWFVMKSFLTIGILAFFIITGLILYKAWKIKRGYVDVY